MNKILKGAKKLLLLAFMLIVTLSQLSGLENVVAKEPTDSGRGEYVPDGSITIIPEGVKVEKILDFLEFYAYFTPVDGEEYTYEITFVVTPLNKEKYHDEYAFSCDKVSVGENFEFIENSETINGEAKAFKPEGNGKFIFDTSIKDTTRYSFRVKAKEDKISELEAGGEFLLLGFIKGHFMAGSSSISGTPIGYAPVWYDLNPLVIPEKKDLVVRYYKDKVSDQKDADGNYLYYLGEDKDTFAKREVGSVIKKSEVPQKDVYLPLGYRNLASVSGNFDANGNMTVSASDEDNVINVVYATKEYYPYEIKYQKLENGELKNIDGRQDLLHMGDKIPFNDDANDPNNDIESHRPAGFDGQVEIKKSDDYTGYIQIQDPLVRNKVVVIYSKVEKELEPIPVIEPDTGETTDESKENVTKPEETSTEIAADEDRNKPSKAEEETKASKESGEVAADEAKVEVATEATSLVLEESGEVAADTDNIESGEVAADTTQTSDTSKLYAFILILGLSGAVLLVVLKGREIEK